MIAREEMDSPTDHGLRRRQELNRWHALVFRSHHQPGLCDLARDR